MRRAAVAPARRDHAPPRGRSRRLDRPSADQRGRTGCTAAVRRSPVSAAMKSCEVPGRELEEVREMDPDGRIVVHHRTVDTLGQDAAGRHDHARRCTMRHATFQADFIIANLDPIRATADPAGAGHRSRAGPERAAARCAAAGARGDAGAGRDQQPGRLLRLACRWLQRSVREWAMRQGWNGRPVRQEQAQGILVAALGVLVGAFGYEQVVAV